MSLHEDVEFGTRPQALRRELPNRLEHPEALVAPADEALVDERLERVEVRVADRLGRRERAAADEDREPREDPLLVVVQEVVRPGDRRTQRLLAADRRLGRRCSRSRRSPEALDELPRREHARSRGGELDRQRQVVEAAAELLDRRRRPQRRERAAEELDRVRLGERRHGVLDLAADAQQLAARHEQAQVRTRLDQPRELGRRVDHLLEVVEQQQQLALADVLAQARPSPRASARSSRARARDRAASRARPRRRRLRYSGTSSAAASSASRVLPEPPGPVSVTQARAVARATRAPRRARAPARRTSSPAAAGSCWRSSSAAETAAAELEDRDGLGEVLQPVLAEVAHARPRRARASPSRGAPARRDPRRRRARQDGRPARRSPPSVSCGAPVWRPIRTRTGPPSSASRAAPRPRRRRPRASANAKKNASPCVSTSTPPCGANASRKSAPVLGQRLRVARRRARAAASSSPRCP